MNLYGIIFLISIVFAAYIVLVYGLYCLGYNFAPPIGPSEECLRFTGEDEIGIIHDALGSNLIDRLLPM